MDFSRKAVFYAFNDVVFFKKTIDEAFFFHAKDLEERDLAFARLLLTTTLRNLGQIDNILSFFLKKKLPKRAEKAQTILRLGTAELLFLKTPAHAALYTSVELMRHVGDEFYTKLVNAVLRKVEKQGEALLEKQDATRLNTPSWLLARWEKAYGKTKAYSIASSLQKQAPLYLSVKQKNRDFLNRLPKESVVLEDNGSLYFPDFKGRISSIPDYEKGIWWVQDKAASLPVLLLEKDLTGKMVADLCAAPGGKTFQLLDKNATVDVFDISEKRLSILKENLNRLHLKVHRIQALDGRKIKGENLYDIVLLDVPCSGTGTIRKNPELLLHLKEKDIFRLQSLQKELLLKAISLLKEGGRLVYSTCSLEKEEAENLLLNHPNLTPLPLPLAYQKYQTTDGFLRTFPDEEMTGFFTGIFTVHKERENKKLKHKPKQCKKEEKGAKR
ncbi:MAG: transcription antitermination factor NusB [Alphaproteobacteria bacterium]|nr:transcription antitermination factor NusB [Alphaproteobacteria bacterium]